MAGVTLAEEVLKGNPSAAVTLITEDTDGYYSRPMLSHGFSRDDIESKIILKSFDALHHGGLKVMAGCKVKGIDRLKKTVRYVENGLEGAVGFDRLVLAPGSDASIPPPLKPFEDLLYVINSLQDLKALRRRRTEIQGRGQQPHWAIIGGGLIGSEVASDLARSGDAVTLFHALPRLMERQLIEEDSQTLKAVLIALGIKVQLEAQVTGFERQGEQFGVQMDNALNSGFDGIIAATGFKPRTQLAEAAGLEVNRGILVNSWLKTKDETIYALGDAAECADGQIYAYVMPIRHQALWLAKYLNGHADAPWEPPAFSPRAKVHGFTAAHAYRI
jgi:NAD(P)H-nitrite reductase large subunit